jgi:hypothetical protein
MKRGELYLKRNELYFGKIGRKWELVRYLGKVRGDGKVGMYERLYFGTNSVLFHLNVFPLSSSLIGREDRRESVKIILERILGEKK